MLLVVGVGRFLGVCRGSGGGIEWWCHCLYRGLDNPSVFNLGIDNHCSPGGIAEGRGLHPSLHCWGNVQYKRQVNGFGGLRVAVESERFTPASAGNTGEVEIVKEKTSVYPRACGEYKPPRLSIRGHRGLPPHLRGIHFHASGRSQLRRFTPAPAGNTPWVWCAWPRLSVYPRACGEYVYPAEKDVHPLGLPPRVRGILS